MSRAAKSSGLTPQERSVMDRYDAGAGIGAISTELRMARGKVSRIVRMYDASASADLAYVRRCRVSDAAYRAALAATGKAFV